jgi:hypothetical protein
MHFQFRLFSNFNKTKIKHFFKSVLKNKFFSKGVRGLGDKIEEVSKVPKVLRVPKVPKNKKSLIFVILRESSKKYEIAASVHI